MPGIIDAGMRYIRLHGLRYTLRRTAEKAGEQLLGTYDRTARRMAAGEEELAAQRANQPDAGLISIVVPVYNTQPRLLRELVASFAAQTYAAWEAVLYDGSTQGETIRTLDELAMTDKRLRVVHAPNEGLSGNTNRGIELAQGAWIVLCDHDDLLAPDALWRVAERIVRTSPDVVYTDEDKITEDSRLYTDGHFKPDFCPDNLRSSNYICHLTAIRRTLLVKTGGLDPAYDGSQDHELMLRCSEYTQRIAHVPHVTYHWRTVGTSVSHQHLDKCLDAARRAVEAHTARIGWPCRVMVENSVLRLAYEIKGAPKVTVIGGSVPAALWPDTEHIPLDTPKGLYAAMNEAVRKATGDVLLFLAPSVHDLSDEAVRELLMYAQRDDVGAVTPVLTDARGHITHAGYVLGGRNGAACRNQGLIARNGGWHLMACQSHNVAAVSAACFMIRRDHFIPFDERYHGPLGMADWCLRLSEAGLWHVYTPHASAVCTDRRLLTPEDAEDLRRFCGRWPELRDPCYSSRFDRDRGNFRIDRRG